MKYLPCEFRQQLGAPIARASSVKTSNIGTLDALAGSVKQPFMQSAAKSDSSPYFGISAMQPTAALGFDT